MSKLTKHEQKIIAQALAPDSDITVKKIPTGVQAIDAVSPPSWFEQRNQNIRARARRIRFDHAKRRAGDAW